MSDFTQSVVIRKLGILSYLPTWQAMQQFTQNRTEETLDEIWCLQHLPVYTQGQAGKAEHILNAGDIPVVAVDRGGQVTYHGLGQLVVYTLIDLKRKQLGVRNFVSLLENTIIETLQFFTINAYTKPAAPGVYVNDAKVASIGLRVRKDRAFHGISLNIDMDLTPFNGINPCGYAGLNMVNMKSLNSIVTLEDVQKIFLDKLAPKLSYTTLNIKNTL